jgi:hypothetical protein
VGGGPGPESATGDAALKKKRKGVKRAVAGDAAEAVAGNEAAGAREAKKRR